MVKRVEIANIQLAFDHRQIIPILKERGLALSQKDWKNVTDLNQQINKYIKSPEGKYALCQVVAAYVTFKTEYGYNMAIERADDEDAILLGHKLQCTEACQPDNIVWENKNIKGLEYITRYAKWTLVMIFILMSICICRVHLEKQSLKFSQMFYPQMDCDYIQNEMSIENQKSLA